MTQPMKLTKISDHLWEQVRNDRAFFEGYVAEVERETAQAGHAFLRGLQREGRYVDEDGYLADQFRAHFHLTEAKEETDGKS